MTSTSVLEHRAPIVVLCLALVLEAACNASDSKGAPAGGPAKSAPAAVVSESAGDVVIPPSPGTPYQVRAVSAPGIVEGTISTKAPLALQPPVPTGRDSAMCGASIADQSVQQQNGGLGGVVVWLDGIRAGKSAAVERRVELESDNCKLAPRMQAAMVGSAVNILGHDNFRQHLRFVVSGESAPRASILLGSGTQVIPSELPFKAPGMVQVRDDGHPWTRAWLAVFDHPYFAVTTPNGSFKIEGVPAGTYTLHAWHERTGATTDQVVVSANGSAKVALSF